MNKEKGIVIQNVSKSFGSNEALKKINIIFEPEKIYGLLGRNGAGKTTLLNLITNRLFADDGDIIIDGLPAIENDLAQGKVYMMCEQDFYPEAFTVQQVFDSTKRFYPGFDMDYAHELCKRVEHALAGDHALLLIVEGGRVVLEILDQRAGLRPLEQDLGLAFVNLAATAHATVHTWPRRRLGARRL
jgi:energy-coupling factor transporter ATP-binding protein EcfA2